MTTQSTTTASPMATTQSPAVSTIVVQAPPAHEPDVVVARPSPDYLWVPGHWTWRDGQYEWLAGHWEIPPHSDAVWTEPRWVPEAGGYRFYEGYWN